MQVVLNEQEYEEYQAMKKDRLDFGFDSIYFRYASVVDELAKYKEREARRQGCNHRTYEAWAQGQKMHFWDALEQLLHAHEEEKQHDTH